MIFDLDNYFEKEWWKTTPKCNTLCKYGDTDSTVVQITAYHFLNNDTVDLIGLIEAIKIYGSALQNRYNYILDEVMGVPKQFNLMDAKLEVASLGASLFAKKNYIIAPIVYDEGTQFVDNKETMHFLYNNNIDKFWKRTKKKGGAMAKKDTSSVSRQMLNDIYLYIIRTLNGEIKNNKFSRYKDLMIIHNKYADKIRKFIETHEYDKVCQTKKFPYKELKTIPKHQLACKLYNSIVDNTIRESDSVYILDCVFENKSLLPTENNANTPYILTKDDINDKLTQIAIPTIIDKEDSEHLNKMMKKYKIHPDLSKIINFNLTMKLEPYEPFFKGVI